MILACPACKVFHDGKCPEKLKPARQILEGARPEGCECIPGRKRALEVQVREQLSFLPFLLQDSVARWEAEPTRHFTSSEGRQTPAGKDKQR